MRNLKKVIALVAVFAMMVTSVAFAQSYSDVKEDDNYYEAIEMLSKLNILTGDDKDGDGVMDFRPNDTITRAEVAAVICRVQDLNNLSQTTTPFTDVPSSHWASGYVAQAAGQGIINGYGDGNFGPEDDVTYEQAVKMFVETLGYTPFVNANGGYPTGHLTAAQRYGVLDGVVGASVGAKATRGQIAQIAFNAIDTPIMDRSSYGKDEEFTIFDGTNNKTFETLLTRDLKVKKVAGIVKENEVSSLTGAGSIDKDEKAKIKFAVDKSDKDNTNYEVNENDTYYLADSDADKYLGYYVNAYVKETDRSNEYDIIAITPSNKNKTISFTLDQYDSFDAANMTINYYKNDNDSKTTSIQLDKTALDGVIYNGIGLNYTTGSQLATNVFGGEQTKGSSTTNSALVEKNSTYSGKVTLIDNDSTNGYDVAVIDIAAIGVVDSVSAAGKVTFLNVPTTKNVSKVVLDFDEDDNNQIVKLTKDGKAMNYADLKKWDVLSIYYSGNGEYYDIRAIDSNKIDSSITNRGASDTSADGYEYTIDGKKYEVAEGAYINKTLNPGTAGVFYIDENNKIVAYDKNGSTTSTTSNGNYAFIINASVTSNNFDKTVGLQILDKSGKVSEPYLNDKVTFENGDGTTLGYTGTQAFDPDTSYKVTEKFNLTTLKDALVNKFVTYETTSNGDIKTITFFTPGDEDDDTNGLTLNYAADSYSYDEEDKEITLGGSKKFDVDDDTVVFYIKGDSNLTPSTTADRNTFNISKTAKASKSASKVGKGSSLGEQKTTNKAVAVFDTESGVAGAIVMLDTTGGFSDSTGIAVIDSTGTGTYNGDTLDTVTYFKDGVKMTSYVDSDVTVTIKGAPKGSLYKFALADDNQLITDAELYATVQPREDDATKALDITPDSANSANLVYGAVYDFASAGRRIKIYTPKTTNPDVYDFTSDATTDSIKSADANVYVIDPKKAKNQIYAGDASEVDYDEDLFKKGAKAVYQKGSTDKIVDTTDQALGMMDYAVAVKNSEGDVVDVIIYKACDFGKYEVK